MSPRQRTSKARVHSITAPVARLRDVAMLADVDPSTVSRVLRGDPTQGVRPETRDRIVEAARELRYRPHAVARSLRTRQTDTFGLLVPTLDNIGFSEVVHGIQAAAAEAGKLVMVVEVRAIDSAGEHADLDELYARLVLDGRVDGLIVGFATADDPLVKALAERRLPLVLVNRRSSGIHGSVVVDDRRGAVLAVEHLISLGHRKIGYVGFVPKTDTSRRRFEGFRSAMNKAGLPIDERWLASGEPTEEGGRQAVAQILSASGRQAPTGIFSSTLLGSFGILTGLLDAGRSVPESVSVVAFNDHPIAAITSPSLTTVRMPNFEMGRRAMRMLIRATEGYPVTDEMLEDAPELIVRASTAPYGKPRS